MKKILVLILFVSLGFSSEIVKKADVVINISDKSKIKIDCKHNGFLIYTFHEENVEHNSIIRKYCSENKFKHIKYTAIREVKEYERSDFNLTYHKDRYLSLQDFIKKDRFTIGFDNKTYENSVSSFIMPKKDLVFESFEIIMNSPNMLGVPTLRGDGEDLTKYENKILFQGKDISYDQALKKAKKYLETKTIFTNNYDIDDITECIEGEIWVKKYGKNTNKNCNWIEK